jgi:hypothetical protein
MKDVAAIAIKPQMKMAIVADSAKKSSSLLSDNRWIANRRKSLNPDAPRTPAGNGSFEI